MPEDNETIDMKEYKKLQTRFNKEQTKSRRLEAENQGLIAGQTRIEKDMEGIYAYFSKHDPEWGEVAKNYMSGRDRRKDFDAASVSSKARLVEMLDEADEDIADAKYAEVRARLAEADSAVDKAKLNEAEEMVRNLVEPGSAGLPQTRAELTELIRLAMSGEEAPDGDADRVDTGSSTRNRQNGMTRAGLETAMEGDQESRIAALDKAFEQIAK